jgi:peroxiredoxin (alkyl hydroperoxide reductase subunit C)
MNDLPVGRSTDETLRLLQAFQYTDKHEEGKMNEQIFRMIDNFDVLVCPAGWRPGADTIIPNPEEKLKYFSKNYEPKNKK